MLVVSEAKSMSDSSRRDEFYSWSEVRGEGEGV